ncbi:hypothetical protein [Ramlibacter sp.]|uniref:hypothetical protein n=1 Tax=Ramlibacter sp. TaxID=1917967 RepID=UPI002FCA0297
MTWQTWSLEQWNEALLRAVFLDPSRVGSTISRIDANARFLARCTGDAGCRDVDARKAFIASFGSTPSSLRARFHLSSIITAASRKRSIPPIFAALYLSLLAASADDNTYTEGDFRRRFAELVSPIEPGNMGFEDLPAMWKRLREWSVTRAKSRGDCAVLVLPDPKHETRIGHSKRIAFPTYKDELELRKLLSEVGLSADSQFAEVATAAYARLNAFSPSFKEELREFSTLLSRADFHAAYDSPFWGAIRDITLEEEAARQRVRGKTWIQVDVSDTNAPQLYVLLDAVAKARLAPHVETIQLGLRGDDTYVLSDGSAYPDLQTLAGLFRRHVTIRESKAGKELAEGWLALFPDALGTFSTDGAHYDNGPACFVVKSTLATQLELQLRHLGIPWIQLGEETTLDGWRGFLCRGISTKGLARVLANAPPSVRRMIGAGWSPPRPRLSGGAWVGRALLLSPASNPKVRMDGAVSGYLRLFGFEGAELLRVVLAQDDEGSFQPMASELSGTSEAASAEYMLERHDGSVETLKVFLVPVGLPGSPQSIKDRSRWLVDGRRGTLEDLDGREARVASAGPTSKWPRDVRFVLDVPAKDSPPVVDVLRVDGLVAPWHWLAEALFVRFQNRSTLTFDLLEEHLQGAATACGLRPWQVRRLLFAGQWLRTLTNRSTPHNCVALSERQISVSLDGDRVVGRVVGLLCQHDVTRIRSFMNGGESCSWVTSRGIPSLGCLEVELDAPSRAHELAREIGFASVVNPDEDAPFDGVLPERTAIQVTPSPPMGTPLESWNAPARKWEPSGATPGDASTGCVLRSTRGERTLIWVKLSDTAYARTDSVLWAWLLSEALQRKSLATRMIDGSLWWPKSLLELPTPINRWWMLHGGGCIGIAPSGHTVFTGTMLQKRALDLGWPADHRDAPRQGVGVARRELALRIRRRTSGARRPFQ